MIRVERGPAPDDLEARSQRWWSEFQAARVKEPTLTSSAFWNRVRSRLKADAAILAERFRHKCAFCEFKPEPCSNPQVEHYRPKSRPEFEDRMFAWENWLLSCGRCNQQKWTHFPDCDGTPCLLDPTCEEPSEHLEFRGAGILPLTTRGSETIRIVGLDRSPLSDDRALWLNHIRSALLLVQAAEFFDAARLFLIWATQDDAPHAAMTRQYLRAYTSTLGRPEIQHPRVEYQEVSELLAKLVEKQSPEIREMI